MKKLIIVLVILLGINISYSQGEEFKFPIVTIEPSGFQVYKTENSYVVLNLAGTDADLYKKTLVWINESYDNPDDVIKSKVDGSLIKVSIGGPSYDRGSISDSHVVNTKYELLFKFKENKIKIEILSWDWYAPEVWIGGRKMRGSGQWNEWGIIRYKDDNGTIDEVGIVNHTAAIEHFNSILIPSLKSAVTEDEEW